MSTVSSQSFGDLLRRYRLAAGLTQEELAAQAGLSVRGLSDLERGARRAPHRETVLLLSEALQLSAAERTRLEAAARQRIAPASGGSVSSSLSSAPALPFVGRAQELALLDHLLTDGPPVLLVAGEPGIGKSRLLQAGIERAESQGWAVLTGGCHRRSSQEPYAPLVSVLADSLRRQSPAEQRLHLQGCTWLVRMLPELAESRVVSLPTWTLPAEQERRLMFGAVSQYLANVAGPAGTLLVLDDLHWAGPDALDLLMALVRALPDRPLRLLAAYRDTEVTSQDPLALLVTDLTREGLASRALIAPLGEEEAAALLAELLPEKAGEKRYLRQQVLERAGGVPLFLVSCVQALGAGQLTQDGINHVPLTLREAILQRVVALQEVAHQILRLASVVGRRVPRAVLVALAARSDLTEEAALEGLEAKAPAPDVTGLAYHFYMAGEWAKVLNYAQRAGEKAQTLYALRTAIEHFTHALEAAHHLSVPSPLSLYRARAQAYETLGEFEQARSDYEQILSMAHKTADRAAEWQSFLDLGFLWTGRDYARAGDYFRRALDLARVMDDPSILAQSLNRLGNWHMNVEEPLKGQHFHQEALTIFQGLNDQRGLAETLDLLGMTNYIGGDMLAGTQYFEQAIELFHELGPRQGLVSSLATLGTRGANYLFMTSSWPTTSVAEDTRYGEEALTIAREMGWRAGEANALISLGLSLGPRGEFARALDAAYSGLGIAVEIGHRVWIATAYMLLGLISLDLLYQKRNSTLSRH